MQLQQPIEVHFCEDSLRELVEYFILFNVFTFLTDQSAILKRVVVFFVKSSNEHYFEVSQSWLCTKKRFSKITAYEHLVFSTGSWI